MISKTEDVCKTYISIGITVISSLLFAAVITTPIFTNNNSMYVRHGFIITCFRPSNFLPKSVYAYCIIFSCFFLSRRNRPTGSGPPHCRGLTITLRHTTLGTTPLDEWSARPDNTQHRQTYMHPVWIEPTIQAGEWPQTYALDQYLAVTRHKCLARRRPYICLWLRKLSNNVHSVVSMISTMRDPQR